MTCAMCGQPIEDGQQFTCHGNPWSETDTGCIDGEVWHSDGVTPRGCPVKEASDGLLD